MLCMLGIYSISCTKEPIAYDNYAMYNPYFKTYTHLESKPDESIWTNYVLLAAAISKTHSYPCNATYDEIKSVRSDCQNDPSLDQLENYARHHETHLTCWQETHENFPDVDTPYLIRVDSDHLYLIIWDIDRSSKIVYYTDTRFAPAKTPEENLQKMPLDNLLTWAYDTNYQFFFIRKKQT